MMPTHTLPLSPSSLRNNLTIIPHFHISRLTNPRNPKIPPTWAAARGSLVRQADCRSQRAPPSSSRSSGGPHRQQFAPNTKHSYCTSTLNIALDRRIPTSAQTALRVLRLSPLLTCSTHHDRDPPSRSSRPLVNFQHGLGKPLNHVGPRLPASRMDEKVVVHRGPHSNLESVCAPP
ncbi:hypothetical protein K456DRAFT_801894 [Colletotrichum gloeosporioides 23]|nr:hypothetical protein K456DRAFT_801894 [Colletotrichum gloeosporioides 23]